jgi:nitrite reductase/ring-hydroxylating ferredoxin subunit
MTSLEEVDVAAPVGAIVSVVVDGVASAAVRTASGWVVVPDACTHAACRFTLDGEVFDGSVLACNCHGSEFDLASGEVLLGPAEVALPVTALAVVDGALRPSGEATRGAVGEAPRGAGPVDEPYSR